MKRLILVALLLTFGPPHAWAEPAQACIAAAHRVLYFMIEEAEGSQLEKVAKDIETKGGSHPAALEIAETFDDQACTMLVMAPGDAVREIAVIALSGEPKN